MQAAAFLFPGQGVLPQDVSEYYSILKTKDTNQTTAFFQIFQTALNEINPQAQFNATTILQNPTGPAWTKTSFIQPLTYTLSILTYEFLKKRNIQYSPAFMLGHSLGAFSALTAADALPFEQGIKIVTARGKYMQEESEKTQNGMIAIIGLTEEKIKEICLKTDTQIALINAPTAFVIGTPRDRFPQIEEQAARLAARKTIRLETSGAFHTKSMQRAYEQFKNFFSSFTLQQPQTPIVTNIPVQASTNPEELKNDVTESIINPVNWAKMIDFLKNQNITSYIETGPGTSLSSLARINNIERDQILHAKTLLE